MTVVRCCLAFSGVSLTGCTGGTSSDSGAWTGPTVTVRYFLWEEDRACWAIRDLERTAPLWEAYYHNNCTEVVDTQFNVPYADRDGHCVAWQHPWGGECKVVDPFFVECDEVSGCCDADRAAYGVGCSPEAWQP